MFSASRMRTLVRMDETVVALLPRLNWGDPLERDGEFLLPVGTVTLLLADVEGSTREWERREREMARAMDELASRVDEAIARHGGVRPLEQGEGDSFVAAFARPSQAVACALDVQRRLATGPIRLRIGIHAGEVQHRADQTYVGPAVNRAARLRDAAHGGQVVLSLAAVELVAERLPEGATVIDLGVHRLKDLSRPERIFQLVHADLSSGFPPLRTLDTYRHNLPVHRTPFFGRQDELREGSTLLAEERLVTLHGGAGAGKTRLATQLAADAVDRFPDGVHLIELAPVLDAAALGAVVRGALGVTDEDDAALDRSVRGKRMLLVLDNCEHLVAACAGLVDRLLTAGEQLVILATSREPLGVPGELSYRVESLPVPPEDVTTIDGLDQYAATQLFVDRARRASSSFDPVPDVAAIANVTRRLDGVPLAIELAAARVRSMTAAEIAAALDERFRLLTGGARTAMPRQQTLQASVDWSYDLLSADERAVFRRLSVFVGGFDHAAARAVCSVDGIEPHHVVDLVGLLVDKSLVVAEEHRGTTRYRLLETLRQYASGRLAEDGDEARDAASRHLAHYIERTETEAARAWDGSGAFDESFFVTETANLEAAGLWARTVDDVDSVARLFLATIPSMVARGGYPPADVLDLLERVEPSLAGEIAAMWTSSGQTSPALVPALERALALGDPAAALMLETSLARLRWLDEPITQAEFDEVIERATQRGDRKGLWCALNAATVAADWAWTGADAGHYWDRYLRLTAEMATGIHERMLASRLAVVVRKGDFAEVLDLSARLRVAGPHTVNASYALLRALIAHGRLDEAEEIADDLLAADVLWSTGEVRHALGRIALARGHVDHALQLFARAEAELDSLADTPMLRPTRVLCMADHAEALVVVGQHDAARAAAEQALSKAFLPWVTAFAQRAASTVAFAAGDIDEAEDLAHKALAGAAQFQVTSNVTVVLDLLAVIASQLESHVEAARLVGAATSLRTAKGDLLRLPPHAGWHEDARARTQDALGPDAFARALEEGAAMRWEEAVDYARRGRGERKRPSSGWASLTPMERKVVDLVAEGLANREVAERLFISERTVGSHLTHVYAKVGVASRTELVAAAVGRRRGVSPEGP